MSVSKISKAENRQIERAKYHPKNGSHDMATMGKSDVAMMTVFNTENQRMEDIKKMKAFF